MDESVLGCLFVLLLNLLTKQSQPLFAFQVVTSRSQLNCFCLGCSVFNLFNAKSQRCFLNGEPNVMSLWLEMHKWSIRKLIGSSSSFKSTTKGESSRRRTITVKLEWALRVPQLYRYYWISCFFFNYYWISCLSLTTFYNYYQKKKQLFTKKKLLEKKPN